jgi:uncharacterized protein
VGGSLPPCRRCPFVGIFPCVDELFPNGTYTYLLGGFLIGGGIGLAYLVTGRIAGISGFLTAAHSWWSDRIFFHAEGRREERIWKGVLVLGIVAGAALHTAFDGHIFMTEVAPWRLLIGGLLVGYGTRMARGCTSGHGICGLSSLSLPSLGATCIFMGVGIGVAHVVSVFGVTP